MPKNITYKTAKRIERERRVKDIRERQRLLALGLHGMDTPERWIAHDRAKLIPDAIHPDAQLIHGRKGRPSKSARFNNKRSGRNKDIKARKGSMAYTRQLSPSIRLNYSVFEHDKPMSYTITALWLTVPDSHKVKHLTARFYHGFIERDRATGRGTDASAVFIRAIKKAGRRKGNALDDILTALDMRQDYKKIQDALGLPARAFFRGSGRKTDR